MMSQPDNRRSPVEPVGRAIIDVIAKALIEQPDQGDWPWEDHCLGVAGQVARALQAGGCVLVKQTDIDALMAELRAEVDRLSAYTADDLIEDLFGGTA